MQSFAHHRVAKATITNCFLLDVPFRPFPLLGVLAMVFQMFDKYPIATINSFITNRLAAMSIPTGHAMAPFPPWLTDAAVVLGLMPGIALTVAVLAIVTTPAAAGARAKAFAPTGEEPRVGGWLVRGWMAQDQAPLGSLLLRLRNATRYVRGAPIISSAWVAAGLKAQLSSVHRRRPTPAPKMDARAAVVLCLPMVVGAANAAPVHVTAGHGSEISPESESLVAASIAAAALAIMLAVFGAPHHLCGQLRAIWQRVWTAFTGVRLHLEMLDDDDDDDDDDASDSVDREDHETGNATAGSTAPTIAEQSGREGRLQWQVPGPRTLGILPRWPWRVDSSNNFAGETEEQVYGHLDPKIPQDTAGTLIGVGSWVEALPADRAEELEDDDLVGSTEA